MLPLEQPLEQPTNSSPFALALNQLQESNRPEKSEFDLSPIGDIREFLLNANATIITQVNKLMDQLPENIQAVAKKFLAGDETAYAQVPTEKKPIVWRVLSILALLALLLSACAPNYEKGAQLTLRGDSPVVINPSNWSINFLWYQQQPGNCSLDPHQSVTYLNTSENGGAYWVQQGDCQGWLPATHVK
ncbi:MAG: hypothetical protein UX28_C0001G0104 [Candidatus Pacebacteria bacterium GW2011_GWA1_46_10]|nr:MAG: hypothetical protein UX28_C0001G0104 [Candidatus Pacebacteria bacterium GW2011_GWA1_46_10]HCR81741.1 hypothetical protein [Candidatus Paceibacterota bacterium]